MYIYDLLWGEKPPTDGVSWSVCPCVCLSVGHVREPCKNVWTDRDEIRRADSDGGPENHVLYRGRDRPRGRGHFGAHRKTLGDFAVVYAKTAEPTVCLSVLNSQTLLPRYLMNGGNNFDKTDSAYSLVATDDLIRFWRSNVKGQGHSRPYVVAKASLDAIVACIWRSIFFHLESTAKDCCMSLYCLCTSLMSAVFARAITA